ncbi:MinD/ParA family protein [Robertmurraya korlensis]|uniref:MinD/ParA family protein n=1 Tax=Robertmurraya korlensis TaxID=519977 RepID=UPI0020411C1D|nr:MinD/ParA family protein [Robertmurraya korlensis]MCM3600171.1 MinD/ParA family protein [Robertmurraya korlensis]
MKDQAEMLRQRIQQMSGKPSPKTLAVVSGKGGVGKSNFSLNFSISLASRGYKVLLFDMDVGMGNIDILIGQSASSSIVDYFEGRRTLSEIVSTGPHGLHYVAGGTGLTHFVNMDKPVHMKFTEDLSNLLSDYEYILFDMGAGATKETVPFILAVDEVLVVTTPEPTSITDAYAMMKHIHLHDSSLPFLLIVNRVHSDNEGMETFKRLRTVVNRFLNREIIEFGMIPDDRQVHHAVTKQTPFIFNERAPAAKAVQQMTSRFEARQFETISDKPKTHFVSKLKRFLFER